MISWRMNQWYKISRQKKGVLGLSTTKMAGPAVELHDIVHQNNELEYELVVQNHKGALNLSTTKMAGPEGLK